MAENYTKRLRDKRDFERRLGELQLEESKFLHNMELQKGDIIKGLYDTRSKSKSLLDTVGHVRSVLAEQRRGVEAELARMTTQQMFDRASRVKASRLDHRLMRTDAKLRNLDGAPVFDEQIAATATVVKFVGKLKYKRKKTLEAIEKERTRIDQERLAQNRPENLSELIQKMLLEPRSFPRKPRKRKPNLFDREKEAQKKEEVEKALTYGTKKRLRRAKYHSRAIEEVYTSDRIAEEWRAKFKIQGAKSNRPVGA